MSLAERLNAVNTALSSGDKKAVTIPNKVADVNPTGFQQSLVNVRNSVSKVETSNIETSSFLSEVEKLIPLEKKTEEGVSDDNIFYEFKGEVAGELPEIKDTEGTISKFLSELMRECNVAILPVSITTIPSSVEPAEHDVIDIGGELYFVDPKFDPFSLVSERHVAALQAGKTVTVPLCVEFTVRGVHGVTYTMTPEMLSKVMTKYSRYVPKLVEGSVGANKLNLVLGDYTYVRT